MTDLPKRVDIHEEGPREGWQIEAGPIPTADKVRFCEALVEIGLQDVQCVWFVDPGVLPLKYLLISGTSRPLTTKG